MNKKKIIIIITLLLVILIALMITLFVAKNTRTPKENLSYINSDEMESDTFSPDMIHLVVAAYDGTINPKAISKSTYYFINSIVPKYYNKCTDDKKTENYYNLNKDNILMEVGIKNKEDFKSLISEIRKLNGKFELEYAKFDRETIISNKSNLEVNLKVKYKESQELTFKINIANKEQEKSSSIKYLGI